MRTILLLLISLFSPVIGFSQAPQRVIDFNPGRGDGFGGSSTVWNGKLYFFASDSSNGMELYSYDESGPPVKISTINPGQGLMPFAYSIVPFGDKLYFATRTVDSFMLNVKFNLYAYDGVNPPFQPAGILNNFFAREPSELTVVGGKMYFAARVTHQMTGPELFMYDGIHPPEFIDLGRYDANPTNFTAFDGKLYFYASDSLGGAHLRVLDPTTDKVHFLTTPAFPNGFQFAFNLMEANGRLYFNSVASQGYSEMFSFDGTEARQETQLTNSWQPGSMGPLCHYAGGIFFVGPVNDTQFSLFRHDMITGANTPVPGSPHLGYYGQFHQAFVYKQVLYFGAEAEGGSEIWRYDGTSASRLADICPGDCNGKLWLTSTYNNGLFTVYNDHLYFPGHDTTHGVELWTLDGDSAMHYVRAAAVYIYPVPSGNATTLVVKLAEKTDLEYRVIDQIGRVVYRSGLLHGQQGRNNYTIPTAVLGSGIYVCTVWDSDGRHLGDGKILRL